MEVVMALAVIALLARVGFALYGAGLVRAKNAASVVTRILADFGFVVLAFWLIGAALLYQLHNGWFGIRPELLPWFDARHIPMLRLTLLISVSMLLSATAGVAGSLSERARFWPLCAASVALGGLILPITAHWAWSGWLLRKGFVDIAGGCALHVSVGVVAAVGATMARPRSGKFNRDGSSSMIPGHNVTLTSVGALFLLVGWTAYIASAAGFNVRLGEAPVTVVEQLADMGSAAWNVLICAAAATVAAIIYTQVRYNKPDVVLILTGMLGGVVAIAAGGSQLPSWAAALTGAVAGIIVPAAVVAIDLRCRIDDPTGSIAIHGVGGAWGTLAVGLFIPHPLLNSRLQQIGIQLIGIVAIALFAAIIGLLLFGAFQAAGALRVREADEFDGLDLAEHDIGAYPDFQQTTIKSYHLREA